MLRRTHVWRSRRQPAFRTLLIFAALTAAAPSGAAAQFGPRVATATATSDSAPHVALTTEVLHPYGLTLFVAATERQETIEARVFVT